MNAVYKSILQNRFLNRIPKRRCISTRISSLPEAEGHERYKGHVVSGVYFLHSLGVIRDSSQRFHVSRVQLSVKEFEDGNIVELGTQNVKFALGFRELSLKLEHGQM